MGRKGCLVLFLLATLLTVASEASFSSNSVNSFPPLTESKAYKQFQQRPVSDLSKILYLIERFQSAEIEIYYDGYYYPAPTAALVAKYFLMAKYNNEKVPYWLARWCHTSIGGKLIYVKFSDGSFRPAHNVLIDEWAALESELSHDDPS